MKAKYGRRDLIQLPFYFTLMLREKDYHKELKLLKIPSNVWPDFVSRGANATAHHFEHNNGKIVIIVCIDGWEKREPIEIVGLLIHEAVHIWQWFKEHIGEEHPSKEFEAYSIQMLSQELMDIFSKTQADIKKEKKTKKEPVKLTQRRSP